MVATTAVTATTWARGPLMLMLSPATTVAITVMAAMPAMAVLAATTAVTATTWARGPLMPRLRLLPRPPLMLMLMPATCTLLDTTVTVSDWATVWVTEATPVSAVCTAVIISARGLLTLDSDTAAMADTADTMDTADTVDTADTAVTDVATTTE